MIGSQISYSKIASICQEMGDTLRRISHSPIIAQERAFATAIMTEDLRVAVQNQYEPEHLYALKESVNHMFASFAFDIADGDVLLIADPYHGGTKGQMLTMAAPLFHEGELVLFPVIRAQITDLAGEYPGGYHPDAFEVWQESMRITPIKLVKQGQLQQDVQRFLLANSRSARLFRLELQTMLACLRHAQQQIRSLLASGAVTIKQAIEEMIQYNRRRIIEHIQIVPEGVLKGEVVIYHDEKPLPLRVKVQKVAERLLFDFTGTADQISAPLNSPLAATHAFAVWPVLAPLADELIINEGVLDSFEIKATTGSLVRSTFPAATSYCTLITGHFIAEVVAQAFVNHGASYKCYASVDGCGSQAVLFPPFGSQAEIVPTVLVPGYVSPTSSWGPSALFGQRQLVSAEELELYQGMRIHSRERKERHNGMSVTYENIQADVYVTLITPEVQVDDSATVKLTSNKGETTFHKSETGLLLKHGDLITFDYPWKGGEVD